jgi:hypothetical protein
MQNETPATATIIVKMTAKIPCKFVTFSSQRVVTPGSADNAGSGYHPKLAAANSRDVLELPFTVQGRKPRRFGRYAFSSAFPMRRVEPFFRLNLLIKNVRIPTISICERTVGKLAD